ncbi:MFS general substrate transporter [Ophiobolus disseminans]|uniref:MFS general substrate transporter n=1 Tax=Ophiobolus disseminans TaxID=1469910 RepID=A0A6A6ZWQ4_9PLEO|nr:MFS general substrate transporter [Ophiobolus disseminans]
MASEQQIPLQKEEQHRPDVPVDTEENITNSSDASLRYLSGWKLHGISFWLFISLFVVQMDTSITSNAILEITDRLGDYEKSSWVFTAYLLTICAALLIFTVFSGACGASQTLTQLIMFRWAQGIRGCGILALTQLVFFELVSPSKWPLYVALFSGIVALSLAIGPLIGGVITEQGQWRWIFWLK